MKTMSKDELEKIRKELEKSNESIVERRSILNPIAWVGYSFMFLGFLLMLTIIGIPFGIGLYRGGKSWVYKNYDKNKGL